MHVRISHLFPFVALALTACVGTAPTLSPEVLQTRSLVVGRIDTVDWRGRSERTPETADLRIDGKLFRNAVRNGYFAVGLLPGRHKLEAMVNDYGGVRVTRSLGQTIDVEAGKNLAVGLLVLWYERHRESNRYRIVSIDNRREMKAWLRHTHPLIWSTAGSRPFELARYPYLRKKEIAPLREEIVRRLVTGDRGMWPLVAGSLGTVARADPGKNGEARIVFFTSRTLSDFRRCFQAGGHIDCGVTEADGRSRLMDFDGRQIVYWELPQDFIPFRIYRSHRNTTYLVDARLRVLSRLAGSRRWHRYDGAALQQNLGQSEPIYFMETNRGIYINTTNRNGVILYLDQATGDYANQKNPGPRVSMWNLIDTPAGTFVGGRKHGLSPKNYLYFRPAAGTRWEEHAIPGSGCHPRIFLLRGNAVEAGIGVYCREGAYVSLDRGRHWKKRPFKRDSGTPNGHEEGTLP